MEHRPLHVALLTTVFLLLAMGVAASVTNGDDSDAPSSVLTALTTTTTKRAVVTEPPDMFLAALAAAVRAGNEAFLYQRLHPEVLERYGETACRAHVARIQDATARFRVRDVSPPTPFEWTLDGRTATIPDAIAMRVMQTSSGRNRETVIQIARVGREFRWFTDCGEPLP